MSEKCNLSYSAFLWKGCEDFHVMETVKEEGRGKSKVCGEGLLVRGTATPVPKLSKDVHMPARPSYYRRYAELSLYEV